MNRANQPFHEWVGPRHMRHGFDLVDLEDPEIRRPPVRLEHRIMIGAQVSGRALPMNNSIEHPADVGACQSRIRGQAATGSCTRSRQWETQRTWFSSARATVCPPVKVDGACPSNDAWQWAAL